ncbi:SHOCT domain-containing protein [Shewanella surugensis]|uniref:SHOCT domain-containing protein n=1 Tax=Shewanella surugensis TaxID=212020 RepID=A0ABT0LL15_9GAMM|nr:SHOCT domain-containing protein [Shewanella surugensis]MCL1127851.1 SHOCT domain-containing protein [Shewanella surugensis]
MKKFTLLVPSLLLLTACSSMSPIEKASESESYFQDAVYGGVDFYISKEKITGERYRIFHQALTGFSGTSGIRRSARKRANIFCLKIKQKQKMLTVSEHTVSPPYILGNFPRIEIIFVCIDDEIISTTGSTDKYDRLIKIKNLLDQGVLTQKEFEIEKKKILTEK